MHFDCAGSHKTVSPEVVLGHFSFKFPHKMDLMTCPSAFPLRRLAQNGVPGGVLGHFSFPRKMDLMTCPCAFPLRKLIQKSCQEGACQEILPRNFLQRSCQQSSYRDFVQDLARRPLVEILYRDLVKRAEVFLADHLQIA